jgi:hypothetical protein
LILLHVGGGYTFLETVAMDIKSGAGLAFWFTDKIGFSLETTYKKSLR